MGQMTNTHSMFYIVLNAAVEKKSACNLTEDITPRILARIRIIRPSWDVSQITLHL